MAPRRGGGSGRASCESCSEPLYLFGSKWQSSMTVARFAFQIIALLIFLICLILSSRMRWVKAEGGRDRLRNSGYKTATIFAFIAFFLYTLHTGLQESDHQTTRLYYLVFIFSEYFWRVADLLILAIILRIPVENPFSRIVRRAGIFHTVILVLLGLLAAAMFGMYTALIAGSMTLTRVGGYELQRHQTYVALSYLALYLVAVMLAFAESVMVFLRDRSKATILMVAMIIPLLFIRVLMDLTWTALAITTNSSARYGDVENISYASSFIFYIATPLVFLGVVLVGRFQMKKTRSHPQKEYEGTYTTSGYGASNGATTY